MTSIIPKEQLEHYKNNAVIIKETAEQIIKDFEMFGLEVEFSGNLFNAYDELFDQLIIHVTRLLKEDYSKLQNLLYRIDLNAKKAFQSKPNYSVEETMTEQILEREFLKVVMRHYFKTKMD